MVVVQSQEYMTKGPVADISAYADDTPHGHKYSQLQTPGQLDSMLKAIQHGQTL